MRRARANHSIVPDYREMLLDKKREVIASLGAKYQAVAHSGRMSEEDQAQFSIDEFITLRLNHLDYQQLKLVDEALDRLSAGDYGVCLACDEPIPVKRLQAVPWAKYCVSCQDGIAPAPVEDAGFQEMISHMAVR